MTNVLLKLSLKINETFASGIIFVYFRVNESEENCFSAFVFLSHWFELKPMSCGLRIALIAHDRKTVLPSSTIPAQFIRSSFHCKFSFFLFWSHQIQCLHKTPFGECRWNFPINFINSADICRHDALSVVSKQFTLLRFLVPTTSTFIRRAKMSTARRLQMASWNFNKKATLSSFYCAQGIVKVSAA